MEPTSLFSGSDNLFKYLFTLGAVMVLISIFYPLQKKYELQIEINTHNKEVDILNDDIAKLDVNASRLSNEADIIKREIDSLKRLVIKTHSLASKTALKEKISNRQQKFNSSFDALAQEREQVKTKNIVLTYDRKKLEILRNQSSSFHNYYVWGLIIGITMIVTGIAFWIRIAHQQDVLTREEIIKIKKDNARP